MIDAQPVASLMLEAMKHRMNYQKPLTVTVTT